jgi:hypothetical protein
MNPEDVHTPEYAEAVKAQFAPKERTDFRRDKWTILMITRDLTRFLNHSVLRSVSVKKKIPEQFTEDTTPCLAFSNNPPIRLPIFNGSAITKFGINYKAFVTYMPGTDIPVFHPPTPECCCATLHRRANFKNFCLNKLGHPLHGHLRTMRMEVLPHFAKLVTEKVRNDPMAEELGLLGASITVTDVENRLSKLSQDLGGHGLNYIPPTKLHEDTIYCHICESMILNYEQKEYPDDRDMGPWILAMLREVRINFMHHTGNSSFFSDHQTITKFTDFIVYFRKQNAEKRAPIPEIHSPMDDPLMKLVNRAMFAPKDGLAAVTCCDKMAKNAALTCTYVPKYLVISSLFPGKPEMEHYVLPVDKNSSDLRDDLWDLSSSPRAGNKDDRRTTQISDFRKKANAYMLKQIAKDPLSDTSIYCKEGIWGQYKLRAENRTMHIRLFRKELIRLFPLIDLFYPEYCGSKRDKADGKELPIPLYNVPHYPEDIADTVTLRQLTTTTLLAPNSTINAIAGKLPNSPLDNPLTMFCTYILPLEDDCIYVGRTRNFRKRLNQHLGIESGGANWTKRHRPTGVIGVYLGDHERIITLIMMHVQGCSNVQTTRRT